MQNRKYDSAENGNFDNHNWWQLFGGFPRLGVPVQGSQYMFGKLPLIVEVLREGVREVNVIKVKAHVSNAHAGQPEWLAKEIERAKP